MTFAAPRFLPETDLGCPCSTDVYLIMVYYTITYYTIKCLPAGFIYSRDECPTTTNLTSHVITVWLLFTSSNTFSPLAGEQGRECVSVVKVLKA